MRTIGTKIAAIFAMMTAVAPLAHAQAPGEVEGVIVNIGALQLDGSFTLTVMGTTVLVPSSAVISTPTVANLSRDKFLSTATFPGRTELGFLGGTAIAIGTTGADGVITAETLFAEPGENVALGIVTQNDAAGLKVNGMPVKFLTEEVDSLLRMPFDVPTNDLGFEINLADAIVGTPVGIEGYYSTVESTFYAFLLEATGIAAKDQRVQISALRALGRPAKGELEIRGGLSGIPGPVTIAFFNATTNAALGQVNVVPDPALPGTAVFRFRPRNIPQAQFPTSVRANVLNTTATVTVAVETR